MKATKKLVGLVEVLESAKARKKAAGIEYEAARQEILALMGEETILKGKTFKYAKIMKQRQDTIAVSLDCKPLLDKYNVPYDYRVGTCYPEFSPCK